MVTIQQITNAWNKIGEAAEIKPTTFIISPAWWDKHSEAAINAARRHGMDQIAVSRGIGSDLETVWRKDDK